MSRIWIYQSNRFLTEDEQAVIQNKVDAFRADWKAHGKALTTSFSIQYNLFLILAVNEEVEVATGCSIDASVHFFKELQNELKLSLFDRQRVAYLENDEVKHCSMSEFKELIHQNKVNKDTIVFNNSVANVADFESHWKSKAKDSWHKMLF